MGDAARPGRIVAFDYLRGWITVLVILHHSVLAYCRYGHFDRQHYLWSSAPIVDSTKWLGFDVLVLFNDLYFMALMFLLSGLFVWPSLRRKQSAAYCRDRLSRLGLPFGIAVVSVIPLAYYPSFRMTGADTGFASFWTDTIFSGPWPAGPAWFLGVLLAFDLTASLAYRLTTRHSGTGHDMPAAWGCFGLLIALSALAYLPLLALFGPTHWFSFGPFAVQASRVGLYGVYFLVGVVVGRLGLEHVSKGLGFSLRQRWARWSLLAVLAFAAIVAPRVSRMTGSLVLPALAWSSIYAGGLVLFCASAVFAWTAIALRFGHRSVGLFDSLGRNAYGMYLLHYPMVIWLQYALLDQPMGAVAKAALVFLTAVSVSWGITMLLRRLPAVSRVI